MIRRESASHGDLWASVEWAMTGLQHRLYVCRRLLYYKIATVAFLNQSVSLGTGC